MYSPQVAARHIPVLYEFAKAVGCPMTKALDFILSQALETQEGREALVAALRQHRLERQRLSRRVGTQMNCEVNQWYDFY